MITLEAGHGRRAGACLLAAAGLALASCGVASRAAPAPSHPARSARPEAAHVQGPPVNSAGAPLPAPAALVPFAGTAAVGQGRWWPAGRLVRGVPAVYQAKLIPPGGRHYAAVAWLDTRLLAARLYSGSISPGGGPYRFTAPVQPAQARWLVAAFNGGFKMPDSHGGYYTEGRMIKPLRHGAASLVIYANGGITVGAWGTDVRMTGLVVSVRQNLVPLVAGSRPTPAAEGNWHAWGSTCGAKSCASSVPGLEHQWRSGLGITADGALVYAVGPALSPLQLALLLVRAGAVRAMQLDINPYWPVLVTYRPAAAGGLAAPANGRRLLSATEQGPATFFEPSWARDFITMSADR